MFMEAASIDPTASYVLLRVKYIQFVLTQSANSHEFSMEKTDGNHTGITSMWSVQVGQEEYFVVGSIDIGFLS